MKTCTTKTCQEVNPQPYCNFYKDSTIKDGYRGQCKSCAKLVKHKYFEKNRKRELDKLKKWKKENPDKVKAANLRNLYGITQEEYLQKMKLQNNSCAICNNDKSLNIVDKRNNKVRDLSVDHCHGTGQIRGLLCYSCNLAVGMIKDNISNAKNLVKYLELYEKT